MNLLQESLAIGTLSPLHYKKSISVAKQLITITHCLENNVLLVCAILTPVVPVLSLCCFCVVVSVLLLLLICFPNCGCINNLMYS